MQEREFTENRSGEILKVDSGIAFLPNRLPPNLSPSRQLFEAATAAQGALGEFVGEARVVGNPNLIIHPLAIREAVLSNKIEGTHTVIANVLLQRAGAVPTDPRQRANQDDVLNYFHALELGSRLINEGWPLSAQLVRSLHEELLRTDGERCALGSYRSRQAYIGLHRSDIHVALREARYVPPPPEQIDAAMDGFFAAIDAPAYFGPLVTCALLHYQFEAIHPFEDGNGRMGRILIPLYLLSKGILDRPHLYLSAYFVSHLEEYLDLMKRVSTHGDWEAWIIFFLEAIKTQAEESRQKTRAIIELHRRYRDLVRTSKNNQQAALAAIDLIMERVFITVKDIAEFAGCSRPTAKTAIDSLSRLGILSSKPGVYPARWVAQQLLDEVYQ
jgi:Fic family protein